MKRSLVLIATLISLTFFTACKTPPSQVATEAAGITVVSVDASMKAWADYVRAGKATQSQVERVHSAYDRYYAASLAEKAALKAYVSAPANQSQWQTAVAVVNAAQGELLSLVDDLIQTPK